MLKDKHTHAYKKVSLVPVVADNVEYRGAPMGVLVRECLCKAQKAFEYGERKKMKLLLEALNNNA